MLLIHFLFSFLFISLSFFLIVSASQKYSVQVRRERASSFGLLALALRV
jgi:hypothetical protein